MSQPSEAATRQWLEHVPSRWAVLPAKALFAERREACLPDDVHLTPSQSHGVLPQVEYMALTGNRVVLNLGGQDSMKHVEAGDFIIHLRSFQGGLERSGMQGKVSTAYTVLTPKERAAPGYFRWLLKSDAYIQTLRTTTNQLRDGQSIRFADFARVALPAPPREEQAAIASFLDRETAKIDALVAEQEGLIQVLRERRVAVVGNALASLTRNATVASLAVDGGFHDGDWVESKDQDPEGEVRLLQLADVGDGFFRDRSDRRLNWQTFAQLGCSLVYPGDLLIARMPDPIGRACIVPDALGPAITVVDVAVLRPDTRRVYPRYAMYAVNDPRARSEVEAQQDGATRQRIPRKRLGRVRVPLPSLVEQERIAYELDQQFEAIDALIGEAEGIVAALRERRTALVSAAVTGEIDVRGKVA